MRDPTSYTSVMEEHWPAILRFCQRVLQSDVDGEEVAQQTFFLGYRAWERFRGQSAPRTWLHRIAINACRRFILESKRRRAAADHQALEAVAADADSCELERGETQDAVHRALRDISPAHRAILTLFYLEGFSGDEVSQVLGCSEGTMWSRLFHARRALERRLRRDDQEESP